MCQRGLDLTHLQYPNGNQNSGWEKTSRIQFQSSWELRRIALHLLRSWVHGALRPWHPSWRLGSLKKLGYLGSSLQYTKVWDSAGFLLGHLQREDPTYLCDCVVEANLTRGSNRIQLFQIKIAIYEIYLYVRYILYY